nr:unnamed protein product [Callosobruchus analis]
MTLLARFDLHLLELRRINHDLMLLYQLVHNQLDSMYLTSRLQFCVIKSNSRQLSTFYETSLKANALTKSTMCVIGANINVNSNVCDINHSSLNEIINKSC